MENQEVLSPRTRHLQAGIFPSKTNQFKFDTESAADVAGTPSLQEIDDEKKD